MIKQRVNQKSSKLSINLVANLVAFVVHAGIQFFVIPILNQQVGDEAYGFISVANEFVQYANILTVLLNGVVGRFVSYEIHKGEYKRANQYFNSVIVADLVLSAVFVVTGIIFVSKVDKVLVISPEIVSDVKSIFFFTFLNFVIVTLFSVMNVASFVKNRIDIAAVRNIIGYLVEVTVVVCLFIFTPTIKSYYMILGTLASSIYLAGANVVITMKIMPEITVSFKDCKVAMLKDLLKPGVWSAISNLSNVLLTSTTLIMGNLFLGGNAVGLVALSKTIPNCINTLFYAIYNVFTPNMVKSYAHGDIDGMVEQGRMSMKVMTFILMPIVAGVIAFIPVFFRLWLPEKTLYEIAQITYYCRIIAIGMMIEMPSLPLMYFAVATNKLRQETMFTLTSSGVLLFLTFIGLSKCLMGGEAVVLSQAINMIVIYLFWAPMYAAKTVGKKWNTFYSNYARCILSTLILLLVYIGINLFCNMDSWFEFITIVMLAGIMGYIFGVFAILSKQQRNRILGMIHGRS